MLLETLNNISAFLTLATPFSPIKLNKYSRNFLLLTQINENDAFNFKPEKLSVWITN